tara:strand:- start:193 stop:492 length:300 start_codon:yes stop_codon:yes gene_type:complete
VNDYYHLNEAWHLNMELTSWFNRLCRGGDLLVGELDLPFLGVETTVEICFIQRGKAPGRIQFESINGYLQKVDENSIHTNRSRTGNRSCFPMNRELISG